MTDPLPPPADRGAAAGATAGDVATPDKALAAGLVPNLGFDLLSKRVEESNHQGSGGSRPWMKITARQQ
jgi:hypothetical protein